MYLPISPEYLYYPSWHVSDSSSTYWIQNVNDNTKVSVLLSWASTTREQHFLFFILHAWLACLPYVDILSTLLLVVCVPSLIESISPIISLDQLFFRAFWNDTIFYATFYYLSSTCKAQNPQTYYQIQQNIGWDITKQEY